MPDGFPYRLASDESVAAGAWATDLGAGLQPVPEYLPAWDLTSELRLQRTIDIDMGRLREETRLGSEAQLALSITFSTERVDGPLARRALPTDLESVST